MPDTPQESPRPSERVPHHVTLEDRSVWRWVPKDAWYCVQLPPTGVWVGGFDLPRGGEDLTATDLRAIADCIDPPAPLAQGSGPQYFIGADRGDLWIPVHATGCATEEETRKVLDLVRKGDEDGGPFAVIRSYEDFTPQSQPSPE